jgi:DnaB-like helicase N terminal domain
VAVDPQDIHSEEALLGAALLTPALTKRIQIDTADFYRHRNSVIWSAAVKCANNGGADLVTVAAELERRHELEAIGGRDVLAQLAASVPAPGNAKSYAKRVKETAELRHFRRIAQTLLDAVGREDKDTIARALDELGQRVVYVDTASGEMVETCPTCLENERIIGKKEHRERQLLARIGQLEGKQEKAAKSHKLWPEISACFDWYKLATAHFKIRFTAVQFHQALPRWKEEGRGRANPCIAALKAIAGIAHAPASARINGKLVVYDGWELLTRNQEKWIAFQDRAPGRDGTEDWKVALVRMIEGNLKQVTKGTA